MMLASSWLKPNEMMERTFQSNHGRTIAKSRLSAHGQMMVQSSWLGEDAMMEKTFLSVCDQMNMKTFLMTKIEMIGTIEMSLHNQVMM
jgi:hypothetical protein